MTIHVYNVDTDQSAVIDVSPTDTLSSMRLSLIEQGFVEAAVDHAFTVRPAGRVVQPAQKVSSLELHGDSFIEISAAQDLASSPFANAEFAINGEPRCPVVLLLDSSQSMSGAPIEALNAGLEIFANELASDALAARRVELAIVSFGPVKVVTEFTSVSAYRPTRLEAVGTTPMGEAIELGLGMIASRKQAYRSNGISVYRPWIFLITDGAPTDQIDGAITKIREGEARNSFSFYAVGVKGADMGALARLNASRDPLMLDGIRFKDFFLWLSNSLTAISRSRVGEDVPLENPTAPRGWATSNG